MFLHKQVCARVGEKMSVSCLVCNKQFETMTPAFMQQHHSKCNNGHQVAHEPPIQQNDNAPESKNCVSNANSQILSFNTNFNGSIQSASIQKVEVAHRLTAN